MRAVASWLRVALVDLRGELQNFIVLIACIALGVGTIAMVGGVSAAVQEALTRDARMMLGGDLEAQSSAREATAEERAALEQRGTVAGMAEVLGRATFDGNVTLLSMRGVEPTYPLIGSVETTAEGPLADALALRDGTYGLIVDELALQRLGAKVGDQIMVGEAPFQIRGLLGALPDQVTRGVAFGIPALMSLDGLRAVNVLGPGVLARWRYKVLFDGQPDVDAAASEVRAAFPDAGWQVSTPEEATADFARFFDLFSRFLTLVGLTALLVGGVGVSNAVSAYLNERKRSIATLKSLGATGGRILVHFLTQIMVLTAVGSLVGLIVGGVMTWLVLPLIGNFMGTPMVQRIEWGSIGIAALFGLLCGLTFALLPLQEARATRPALLFRSAGAGGEPGALWQALTRPSTVIALLFAAGGIFALAVVTTAEPELVIYYTVSIVVAFVVLMLAAWLLQVGMRLLPPMPNATVRNAVKGVHQPGAHAPTVLLSLSLGLSLLVLISLVDHNLRQVLTGEITSDAPSFVFMDLFDDEAAALAELQESDARITDFTSMPIIRAAITAINGKPATDIPPQTEVSFSSFFGSEVPVSYSEAVPQQSTVTAGEWWHADYDGEPLVSVSTLYAKSLGLKLGDTLTLTILGEPLDTKVASFREVTWENATMNFDFVLSPDAASLYPWSFLGLMKTAPGEEVAVQQNLVSDFPDLMFLRFDDALNRIATFLNALISAIGAIGGLALASGVLVLAGAMAAGRKQREANAVVQKVLGATRGDILVAFLVEHGLLGVLSALLALVLGIAGAWAFVSYGFGFKFEVDPGLIASVLAAGIGITVIIGAATTWAALSVRPVQFLRAE